MPERALEAKEDPSLFVASGFGLIDPSFQFECFDGFGSVGHERGAFCLLLGLEYGA